MQDYQLRVIAEGVELRDKISKLNTFIQSDKFKALDNAEQSRLARQIDIMCDYLEVLTERIAAFKA